LFLRLTSTIIASFRSTLKEPSTYNFQVWVIRGYSNDVSGVVEEVIIEGGDASVSIRPSKKYSTMKSVKTRLFIAS